MMKSFFKKLAFVMALAMVVSLAAPAAQASAAEEQKFTYAYQDGGKVTKLYMNAEETVDLKFVGVKNYADKKSDLEMNWVTYPKSVATVDQSGVVTAVADGKAIVYLEITDKTGEVVYTSDAVDVVVGEELAPVKLGTSKEDLADLDTVYELAVGEAVDLAFFGVPNYNKTNYTVTWVAYENVEAEELVEATAVTVDKNGVVVAVAEGEADVMAVIVNNMTDEALAAEWVNFLVVPAVEVEPTPEPTLALGVSAEETFTEKTLEVEGTVDLAFFGIAEENLVNYTYTWISNDPEVATVDQNGIVTAVAPGTATVSVAVINNVTGETLTVVPVTFTVPTPKAPLELTVKQTAGNKVTVTFSDAAAATDKINLVKLIKVGDEVKEMPQAYKTTVKDGVATIESYIPFADGEEFLIYVEGVEEAEPFNAYVGPITGIKVVAKTGDKEICYVNEAIKFEVTYLAGKEGDIPVSAAQGSWTTFEVLEQDDNVYVDSTYGTSSYIYAERATAKIKAVYNYYDANYEIQTIPYEFTITGVNRPAENFKGINGHTITSELSDASKVTWNNTTVTIKDGACYVGLNVGTTTDGVYYVNAPIKDKTAYPTTKGEFTFASSNEKVVLVGPNDGSVTGVTAGEAYIIVSYATRGADGNLGNPVAVYAIPVTVRAAREATHIKVNDAAVTNVSVLTKDNAGGTLTTATVTYKVYDQYWDPYNVTNSATTETNANIKASAKTLTLVAGSVKNNEGKFSIDGTLYADENVSYVDYIVKIAGVKNTATIRVTPKKPVTTTTGGSTVVTNGYDIDVKGLDVNVKKEKLNANSQLLVNITNYTTWSGTKTGYVADLKKFDKDDFFTKNASGLAKDDFVIKITGPDGKLFTNYTIGTNGKVEIVAATMATGTALNAIATGTYQVNLYAVNNVTPNTGTASGTSLIAFRPLANKTFEIKNTAKQMSIKSLKTGLTSSATTVEAAVLDLVTFQFDGKDYTPEIVRVNGTPNASAKKYYVDSVVVRTYINDTQCYFEQTLEIKEVFNMPNM